MKNVLRVGLLILALTFLSAFTIYGQSSFLNNADSDIKLFLEAESGFVKLWHHTIKIGNAGSNFNYITQGGQEILFPVERYSIGLVLADQHKISFLYQPLEINTSVRFKDTVTIDDETFASGSVMDLTYSFPFYRLTYGYDFFSENQFDLGVGGALQLRNASIRFKKADGTAVTVSQNVGPVPALHFFTRYIFDNGFTLGFDLTGLYASSAIINGANFEFEGSILDTSVRGGYLLNNSIELFVNLRFLGGSAKGTSQYPDFAWTESSENFTANYLATTTLTLGATVR